jgi:hypothetical protein
MLHDRLTWGCVAIIVGAAAGWALVSDHFEAQRSALQRAHERRMEARRQQLKQEDSTRRHDWVRQSAARRAAWEQAARDRRVAQRKELEQALGGPLGWALKNPELSIREMLLEAGKACAPAETVVEVTLDRFTEFDAALVFDSRLGLEELEPIVRCFLGDCAHYLNAVRFISGSELLFEIDKSEIDAVADWKTARLEPLVAMRMEAQAIRSATVSSTSGTTEALQPVLEVPEKPFAESPGRTNSARPAVTSP